MEHGEYEKAYYGKCQFDESHTQGSRHARFLYAFTKRFLFQFNISK